MRRGGFLGRACQGGGGNYQGRTRDAPQLCSVHEEPHLPHLQTFNTSGATISVFLFRHAYHALTIFAS